MTRYKDLPEEEKLRRIERAKAWTENLRETNLARSVFLNTRRRARYIKVDFNLDESDIEIPEVCPILGLQIKRGKNKKPEDFSPSVDRVDPTKGYTKGNVQIISNKANAMKNSATPEELRMFAKWVLKTFPEEQDGKK